MWDLSCIRHNGDLTGYRVEYGTMSFDNVETVGTTSFTATGLTPNTVYMFRVAAVNSNGVGQYSGTLSTRTLAPDIVVEVIGSSASPRVGDQYTLTCTPSGHQMLLATVTYQWLNNSIILQNQNDSTLVFNPVNRHDSGIYTCLVTLNSPLLNSIITAQGTTFLALGTLTT